MGWVIIQVDRHSNPTRSIIRLSITRVINLFNGFHPTFWAVWIKCPSDSGEIVRPNRQRHGVARHVYYLVQIQTDRRPAWTSSDGTKQNALSLVHDFDYFHFWSSVWSRFGPGPNQIGFFFGWELACRLSRFSSSIFLAVVLLFSRLSTQQSSHLHVPPRFISPQPNQWPN